jgi:elongation factor P
MRERGAFQFRYPRSALLCVKTSPDTGPGAPPRTPLWPRLVLARGLTHMEPMIATADFRRGARILVDGQPFTIEEHTVQTPSARGAATLVKARLRHIVTGQVNDRTFKAGERFEEPDVSIRNVQYLFADGDGHHFMDLESYEQFTLAPEDLGDAVPWLTDNLECTAVVYNGAAVGVNLPAFVEAEVDMVGAGSKADTASGKNTKEAVLTNGETVRVPLFVGSGERILIDTRTWEFAKRAPRS